MTTLAPSISLHPITFPRIIWSGFLIRVGLGITVLLALFIVLALVIGSLAYSHANQLALPVGDNVQGTDRIYLMDVDHGLIFPVFRDKSIMQGGPLWSPDGSLIAFEDLRNGYNEIYLMNADGSQMRQLTHEHPDLNSSFAWSPDGRQIVFINQRQHKLNRIDVQDGLATFLVDLPDKILLSPVWSPDGNQIAFLASDFQNHGTLYLIDKDGQHLRQIGKPVIVEQKVSLAWSPDGQALTFDTLDTGAGDIYRISPTGSNLQRLTHAALGEGGAAWSPDSNQIAYWLNEDRGLTLYSMKPDGSSTTRLNHVPASACLGLSWSSDGKRIAFGAYGTSKGTISLYVMNADGSDLRYLTEGHEGPPTFPIWRP
jgi:TolB protein